MGEPVPDVAVEETDQGTVGEQGEEGPDVDGIEVPIKQEGDDHDENWREEVDELGLNDPVMQIEKAQDVGGVIVGMHNQVGPLVDRNRTAEGGNTQKAEEGADQEGQVGNTEPGEEGHEDVDEVAEASDKADLTDEAPLVPLADQELVGDGG